MISSRVARNPPARHGNPPRTVHWSKAAAPRFGRPTRILCTDPIALKAKRRDKEQMHAVFDRDKDVEGKGLSKAALMAALTEVSAPVLSSSDDASEDRVFRRADTNCSSFGDLDDCCGALDFTCCVRGNAAAAGSCCQRARRPRNVSGRSQLGRKRCGCWPAVALTSLLVSRSLLRRCWECMRAVEPTNWEALRR
jgi:hypothetical protein